MLRLLRQLQNNYAVLVGIGTFIILTYVTVVSNTQFKSADVIIQNGNGTTTQNCGGYQCPQGQECVTITDPGVPPYQSCEPPCDEEACQVRGANGYCDYECDQFAGTVCHDPLPDVSGNPGFCRCEDEDAQIGSDGSCILCPPGQILDPDAYICEDDTCCVENNCANNPSLQQECDTDPVTGTPINCVDCCPNGEYNCGDGVCCPNRDQCRDNPDFRTCQEDCRDNVCGGDTTGICYFNCVKNNCEYNGGQTSGTGRFLCSSGSSVSGVNPSGQNDPIPTGINPVNVTPYNPLSIASPTVVFNPANTPTNGNNGSSGSEGSNSSSSCISEADFAYCYQRCTRVDGNPAVFCSVACSTGGNVDCLMNCGNISSTCQQECNFPPPNVCPDSTDPNPNGSTGPSGSTNPPGPTGPTAPSQPTTTDPESPIDSDNPTDSDDPTNPIENTNPTESVNPADTTDPIDSADPTDNTDPINSANPTDSADPDDPIQTSNPADTTDPIDSANPTDSADPAGTTNPEDPINVTNPPTENVNPEDPINTTNPPTTNVNPEDPINVTNPPTENVNPEDPINTTNPPTENVNPEDPINTTNPPTENVNPEDPINTTNPPTSNVNPDPIDSTNPIDLTNPINPIDSVEPFDIGTDNSFDPLPPTDPVNSSSPFLPITSFNPTSSTNSVQPTGSLNPGCTNDAQCTGPGAVCFNGSCYPCTGSQDCGNGLSCINNLCQSNILCGNNQLDDFEQCDDGNTLPGDGCNSICMLEITNTCGDATVEAPLEECDDGNTIDGDGCSSTCRVEEFAVRDLTLCGDGILASFEECDDGNDRNFDGCNNRCLLEEGACGDGIIQRARDEQCEPTLHDASLPYSCGIDCRFSSSACGNGLIDPGEECDAGNQNSNTPNANCRLDCRAARCGDTIKDANVVRVFIDPVTGQTKEQTEQCDDGNTIDGDGCSADCQLELQSAIDFLNVDNNRLPLATITRQTSPGPVGDTGPIAVGLIAMGAAAGIGIVRRRKK